MKVYVDGKDLLGYFIEQEDRLVLGPDQDQSRQNLRRWLARYAELQDCDVVLVWDELAPDEVLPLDERFGRVHVINLPYGENALQEIAGPANRTALEERTFVTTADPRLMDALERGKATTYSPAEFVSRARRIMGMGDEQMAKEPDEKFAALGEDEVEFWMNFFQKDED
ncbi:MAG: NYN domain-containing protein [Planctomycetes bacterium]|nr:NYN domain-containing protein [Planctomycetota bacterium]